MEKAGSGFPYCIVVMIKGKNKCWNGGIRGKDPQITRIFPDRFLQFHSASLSLIFVTLCFVDKDLFSHFRCDAVTRLESFIIQLRVGYVWPPFGILASLHVFRRR